MMENDLGVSSDSQIVGRHIQRDLKGQVSYISTRAASSHGSKAVDALSRHPIAVNHDRLNWEGP